MTDKYVMAAGTALLIYVLSVRKRHCEILENLGEISNNMHTHQRERDDVKNISKLNPPISNDPSPISINEILCTPTPVNSLNDEIDINTNTNTNTNTNVNPNVNYLVIAVLHISVCLFIGTMFYCSYNKCGDVFGPDL